MATSRPNVFLYRRGCKLCYDCLDEVIPFLTARNLPVVVETITGMLAKEIPYVPALLLRTEAFNTDQEIVIMGRGMIEQLQVLEAATLKSTND
jgi:hypothetical protein